MTYTAAGPMTASMTASVTASVTASRRRTTKDRTTTP